MTLGGREVLDSFIVLNHEVLHLRENVCGLLDLFFGEEFCLLFEVFLHNVYVTELEG